MTSLDDVLSGIVDAHVQHWNPRRTPWAATHASRLSGLIPRLGDRAFPLLASRADREFVLNPRTVARPYEPPLAGIVAHGDPRDPDFGAVIDEQLTVSSKVRGVRLVATRHPDPKVRSGGDSDNILSSTRFLDGFAEIADRKLVFEAAVYSHQLNDVVVLAREYPETTIVLDHFGMPAGAFGPVGTRTGATAAARADIYRLWRERMTTLASYRNVVVKLSGMAMPVLGYGHERWGNIGGQSTLGEMIGPFVEHVVTHFGSDRIMFGSNYPIDRPNAAIDVLIGALLDCVSRLGDETVRRIFHDTAVRVYRLGDAGL